MYNSSSKGEFREYLLPRSQDREKGNEGACPSFNETEACAKTYFLSFKSEDKTDIFEKIKHLLFQ